LIIFSDVYRNQAILSKNLAYKDLVVGGHNKGQVNVHNNEDFNKERFSGSIKKL